MSGDKRQLGWRVDEQVAGEFEEFVREKHGSTNGYLGRELQKAMESWSSGTDVDAVERRLESMEDRLDAMADTLSRQDRERENESSSASGGSFNARTERKVDAIEEKLPDGTDVDASIVEHIIEENAGTARKTVQKYKRLLRNRGIAFPDPVEGAFDDLDNENWVVGRSKFAIRLESNPDVSAHAVDRIVGTYDDYLGENWYFDALPDDWLKSNQTKLESVAEDSTAKRLREYRRRHGLLDQDDAERGFM